VLHHLPAVNASLNGVAFCLLVAGFVAIKRKQIPVHRGCMLGALLFSAAFLTCYVIYHMQVGSKPFPGAGIWRWVYFGILIPHVILAALVMPMILVTAHHALQTRFDAHRRIARWTMPIWLFVSFSGVVVYFMLYRINW
jgi:uncharacterized membrane protein YozB (DUF420 family)